MSQFNGLSNLSAIATSPREFCYTCWRAVKPNLSGCYCSLIQPFDAPFQFIFLAHPVEARNQVGTLRIARLSIRNSITLIGSGADFDTNPTLMRLLSQSDLFPVVLFPSPDAISLDEGRSVKAKNSKSHWLPTEKTLTLILIDGTWKSAKHMVERSKVLSQLPKASFAPEIKSDYRIRKQPHPHCLSTVEAAYIALTRLENSGLYPRAPGSNPSHMLSVFKSMVDYQINCKNEALLNPKEKAPF